MTGEEHFLTAIIEQAIEDCAYTGTSVKMLKIKRLSCFSKKNYSCITWSHGNGDS